jgi:hypothetical protein
MRYLVVLNEARPLGGSLALRTAVITAAEGRCSEHYPEHAPSIVGRSRRTGLVELQFPFKGCKLFLSR